MVAVAKQLDVDNTLLPSQLLQCGKHGLGWGDIGKNHCSTSIINCIIIIQVIECSWITDSLYLQQYSSYVCGYLSTFILLESCKRIRV